MRKLVILSLVLAAVAVMTPTVANAQAYPFEASVLQVPTGNAVFQRYYTEGKATFNPGCEGSCPTKPCDQLIPGQPSCQLIFNAKGLSGYRGYSEDIFNFQVGDGTIFNSIFDHEKNPGAGNHQGFYAWVRGTVVINSTSLWTDATCTGVNGTDCLGVATASTARSEAGGVPASSGGPAIPNVGGLSPIPVPKAAPGSTQTSFNLSWAAISSVGEASGVAPVGYEVWGARTANCATPATANQFAFVRLVNGTTATITEGEVPGSGAAFTFALKIRFPAAGGNTVSTRYLSANGQCILGGGLSASVYELAAKYAGKTNVEVSWKTSLEDGVRGFYVSRATTQNGPYARVSDLIPAKGEASAYSFIDAIQVPAGNVKATGLWYKVETIDIDDNAVEYGPTKAQLPGPSGNAVIKQRSAKPQR
jgi:hypothetical protein